MIRRLIDLYATKQSKDCLTKKSSGWITVTADFSRYVLNKPREVM
jgi:hypothetical protein